MLARTCALMTLAVCATVYSAAAKEEAPPNRYVQSNFVANKAAYNPSLGVEPGMINAWGIAIRPAGAGGHFWVTAKDTSFEYVGDVSQSADAKLHPLHQDELKTVKLPVGGDDKFATGIVFSDSKDSFVITQKVEGAEPITAPAKFLFASDGGIISAWTERKKAGGGFDRAGEAISVIDRSKEGAQYFGLAINAANNRIYAANFGAAPGIETFDGTFAPVPLSFDMPFDSNKNGKVDPGEYAPFNIQALTTPAGERHLFVAYAKTQACPAKESESGGCKKGELFAGEEDTSQPGYGRIAEFTEEGKLVAVWKDGGHLSAPWGMAYAPAQFGALSGKLLVGNFGDGTIAAFDPATRSFVDVMRSAKGKPVKIDKLWGILFGNGESLGDKNALYIAAGPDDEKDGVFGSLRVSK